MHKFLKTIKYRVSLKQSENYLTNKNLTNSINSNASEEIKKGMSIYMKILLNYLQMITILQNFELKWPFYVRNYLNFFASFGGGLSAQVISTDCLLEDYNIDIVSLYAQTWLISFMPFMIYFVAGVILTLIYLIKRKSQIIRFIVVVIVVSIFLQPSILKILFDNLSCQTLENTSYLTQDMMISCDSDSHTTWVIMIFF